jgi:glycosyltransferase involved in cell wall biosynthesis
MADLYAWADVFLLPSICEGSAMVTYEALSWGLPVITTHNAGSIVRDTVDGWLVPIRDSEAIAKKLLIIFEKTPRFAKPNNLEKPLEEVYNQLIKIFIDTEGLAEF